MLFDSFLEHKDTCGWKYIITDVSTQEWLTAFVQRSTLACRQNAHYGNILYTPRRWEDVMNP